MSSFMISCMKASHIDALLSIESRSFKNPWGKPSFLDEISNPQALSYVFVLPDKNKDQIIGYACFRRILDELHMLKIAVQPSHRRKGIAYDFLNDYLNGLAQKGVRSVFLEVRPSNQAALGLYHKLGFHIIGKRPKYYLDTGEDAVIMRKRFL